MALARVRHMYADLEQLAPTNPGLPAGAEMAMVFNVTLQKAKIDYPESKILAAVADTDKDTTLADLLIRVGTLKEILAEHERGSRGDGA